MGFTVSNADPGLYTAHYKYTCIYVDDILIAAQAQEVVEQVKEKLTAAFDVTWARPSKALSLDRTRPRQTLKVTQELGQGQTYANSQGDSSTHLHSLYTGMASLKARPTVYL